jgi:hypothetical protein
MTQIVVAQRMWQRRDTAANWTSVNPVLQAGEIGVELGATEDAPQKFKIGNGTTPWTELAYAGGGDGSFSQVVTSISDPHTLSLLDFNKWIEHPGGEIVLPPTDGAGIFDGWHTEVVQASATGVTFTRGAGVTLRYNSTLFSAATRHEGAAVVVKCVGEDTYRLVGALADA